MAILQEKIDCDPNNSSHHFDLGCVLWSKAEEEDSESKSKEWKVSSVEHFVLSAKLNPSNGAAFRYLGHYYVGVSADRSRAAKCYQRAVSLNPDDFEAGEGLCDLLEGDGKESLQVAVCREASQKSPRAYWAFRRLGYLHVIQEKWSEAVQSLQHAIRGYPSSADLWEALGLAYHRLGMFTSALKSYRRALELEDSKLFALVESGDILLMLGSFSEGVEQMRSALELSPHNVSACFGLASGLLGLSKECISSGAFSWGALLLEEASSVAKKCTNLVGNVSSIWKLLGDIQMAHARCFPWVKESTHIKVNKEALETSIHRWRKTCKSSAVNAKHSYQRALHLTPWEASKYTDIAISLDLVHSLEGRSVLDLNSWSLPEKMTLGGLMLDRVNNDIWMILGCLSNKNVLKQHSFIRALQLDVSFSVAWAHLGKFYRNIGENKLAKQAFDHARSIDPSLALPWASMSICVDANTKENSTEEAYESCLRAAQILPLAEFQVGLGAIASLSGHLLCPHVFGSVTQAVQRVPFCPASHNLNGLVCEAREDFQSAIVSYRRAKCALDIFPTSDHKYKAADVSFNLSRSLCKSGYIHETARECEHLKNEGMLDGKGLQIYAFALFLLGQKDLALAEAKCLGLQVSTMDDTSRNVALGFICRLLYSIKGSEATITTIVMFPQEFYRSSKIMSIIYAISAFGRSDLLQSVLPVNNLVLLSHEETGEMQHLVALSKLLSNDNTEQNMGIQRAIEHLKKSLHMWPNSNSLRIQLSSLLLSSKDWMASHVANRCLVIPNGHSISNSSKSSYEVLASTAVACYSCCTAQHPSSFSTSNYQFPSGTNGWKQLQKWLHQEPWNNKAQYLLVLYFLQKARYEKFPRHTCDTLKHLISTALSNEIYAGTSQSYAYQKFQLLLCLSEICMQSGDYFDCVNHATDASTLIVSKSALFFAHLQLCRAHAALKDMQKLGIEYIKCLRLKTDHEIGWVSLNYLDYKYKLQENFSNIDFSYEQFCLEKEGHTSMWTAVLYLVLCQRYIWDTDFIRAEQALRHANSIGIADKCLLLCHGAICVILARQASNNYQLLSLARSSLIKAEKLPLRPLPVASALLAQAEGSLGSKPKWEKNLRAEWFSWPPEMKPAELYFQMHLLAIQATSAASNQGITSIESSPNPASWVLRAIHLNPSCRRYWKALQKLIQEFGL